MDPLNDALMHHNKPKKRLSLNMILTLFISFIMVASILGYSMLQADDSGTKKYGDYKLVPRGSLYVTKINNVEIEFDFLPEEVKSIDIPASAVDLIKGTYEVDYTYSYDDEYAEEIAVFQQSLERLLDTSDIFMRTGFLEENDFEKPIITCDDATTAVPVMMVMQSNETAVTVKGACIIAKGSSRDDILRIKDKIMYDILGIKIA